MNILDAHLRIQDAESKGYVFRKYRYNPADDSLFDVDAPEKILQVTGVSSLGMIGVTIEEALTCIEIIEHIYNALVKKYPGGQND